jgi:hypothetical protein
MIDMSPWIKKKKKKKKAERAPAQNETVALTPPQSVIQQLEKQGTEESTICARVC